MVLYTIDAMKTCAISGCDKPYHAKGSCLKHYRRSQKASLLQNGVQCTIEGCRKTPEPNTKGICWMHYTRLYRHGNTRSLTKCKIETCQNNRHVKGYCQEHYERFKGSAGLFLERSDRCLYIGCNKPTRHKLWGLCDYHYDIRKSEIDPNYRIAKRLRNRLNTAVKTGQKSGSAVRELGCSIDQFKLYIESLFKPGMSWDNWAHDTWHLDHIIPLSHFDLTDREQFLRAINYTNYQPLWATDNFAKGAKLEWKPYPLNYLSA